MKLAILSLAAILAANPLLAEAGDLSCAEQNAAAPHVLIVHTVSDTEATLTVASSDGSTASYSATVSHQGGPLPMTTYSIPTTEKPSGTLEISGNTLQSCRAVDCPPIPHHPGHDGFLDLDDLHASFSCN
jgi:hypothetical protein